MSDSYKLATIGTPSTVTIFRIIGCDTYPVDTPSETGNILQELIGRYQDDAHMKPEYAIIFVDENLYQHIPQDLLDKLAKRALPAVIPVPSGKSDAKSFAMGRLSKIVERAVGSDIMK